MKKKVFFLILITFNGRKQITHKIIKNIEIEKIWIEIKISGGGTRKIYKNIEKSSSYKLHSTVHKIIVHKQSKFKKKAPQGTKLANNIVFV